jgi:hypothetical protein
LFETRLNTGEGGGGESKEACANTGWLAVSFQMIKSCTAGAIFVTPLVKHSTSTRAPSRSRFTDLFEVAQQADTEKMYVQMMLTCQEVRT